jgi:hypothetical protein
MLRLRKILCLEAVSASLCSRVNYRRIPVNPAPFHNNSF